MGIVLLRCPHCNGELQFEDNREFGFCQYCGAKVMIEKGGSRTTNITHNTTNYSGTVINNYGAGCVRDSVICELCRDAKANNVMGHFTVIMDGFNVATVKRKQVVRIEVDCGYHDLTIRNKYIGDYVTRVKFTSDIRLIITAEGVLQKRPALVAERLELERSIAIDPLAECQHPKFSSFREEDGETIGMDEPEKKDEAYQRKLYGRGECHQFGTRSGQSYEKAAECYREAAELGYAPAQWRLGECYHFGLGVGESHRDAAIWFRKAAEQGHMNAQAWMGYCCLYGDGIRRSYREAVKWLRLAADQGDPSAQCNLGFCYENGHGIKQSYREAVRWYRKAADQTDVVALGNMGRAYESGHGVGQSYEIAAEWYRLAAEHGHPEAQRSLKRCLAHSR